MVINFRRCLLARKHDCYPCIRGLDQTAHCLLLVPGVPYQTSLLTAVTYSNIELERFTAERQETVRECGRRMARDVARENKLDVDRCREVVPRKGHVTKCGRSRTT